MLLARDGEQCLHKIPHPVLIYPDIGVFYSSDGNYTRERSLQWPSPPEALGEALFSPFGNFRTLLTSSILQPVHLLCPASDIPF